MPPLFPLDYFVCTLFFFFSIDSDLFMRLSNETIADFSRVLIIQFIGMQTHNFDIYWDIKE